MSDAPVRARAPRTPPSIRRDQILDAALRIIDAHGYAAATMEAIARETGVTKPVVYDIFGTRPKLLEALMEREEEQCMDALLAILPDFGKIGAMSPEEVFVTGFESFLEAVSGRPVAWRLVLRPIEGTPDVLHAHIDARREQFLAQLEAALRWGLAERGTELKRTDMPLLARMVMTLGEQSALLTLGMPEEYPPERLTRFVRGALKALVPQ